MSRKHLVFADFIAVLCWTLAGCGGPLDTSLSLPVEEREVTGQQLVHNPSDSLSVRLNPPGFTWTAHERAGSYRFLLFRGAPGREILVRREK